MSRKGVDKKDVSLNFFYIFFNHPLIREGDRLTFSTGISVQIFFVLRIRLTKEL